MLFEFVIEGPHPSGGEIVAGEVLMPVQDRHGMSDGDGEIAGDVFYAFTATGPELGDASTSAGDADEFEESWLARESFPSDVSTISSMH